jgi:hypothetical protein
MKANQAMKQFQNSFRFLIRFFFNQKKIFFVFQEKEKGTKRK